MGNAIGIDFGTTKTMVSYLNPSSRRAELVRLGRDRDSIPTTVHVDEAGSFLFGEDADDQIETDPEGYCRAFKLHLGEKEPALPRAGETAESLATRFLRHMKEECEQSVFHGGTVDTATITIPVAFAPARKSSLKRAARAAGFNDVSFLPEPEAAGMAFLRDNPSDSFSRALVLDWGGGTLDIAIISRDEDGTIHADRHCAEGRDDMGGEELDRGLLFKLDELWKAAHGAPLLSSEENEPKLLREAEKIKIALSRKNTVTFRRGPKKIEVRRAQFANLAQPLFDAAADLVRSALSKNRERGNPDPDSILLIGGTSQTPLVRETMESAFPGLRVLSWHHSHEAVALGATFQSEAANLPPVPENMPDGIPDDFKPAWQTPDIDLSPLGGFAGGKAHPYFGFDADDEALALEKGLIVRRKRLGRFAVVPFVEDSGQIVDIQFFDGKFGESPANPPRPDTPFAQREREAFDKLCKKHLTLWKLHEEFDWFVSNSAERYANRSRGICRELAQLESGKKDVEKQLVDTNDNGNGGFFSSIKTQWKVRGLEAQAKTIREKIDVKKAELCDLDAEAKRHADWPKEEKTEELAREEETFHAAYLQYCSIRHFRIRWEREVLAERRNLDVLENEIQTLNESARQLTDIIVASEKQLEVLRKNLADTTSSIAEKEKECARVSDSLSAREEALQKAFDNGNPSGNPSEPCADGTDS